MDIQGYFTKKGLALSAKLATGALLTITRVVAGARQTADHMETTSLPQPKQTLAVNSPTRTGNTATIPVTLAAAQAEEDYTLTELGVYAQDPDEGEILYKLYRLDTPVDIKAGSRLVLRFYLEETVSQDVNVTVNCSPNGLITEKELEPLRNRLFATYAPVKEVTLEAAALPAYIMMLPRLITEKLILHISGTLEEPLLIAGFYGSGSIVIDGGALENCTLTNVVHITDCSISIGLKLLTFEDSGAGAETFYQSTITAMNVHQVYLDNCALRGNGTGTAIRLANASIGWISNSSIQNFNTAVASFISSVLSVFNVAASGNQRGIDVYCGGIVLLHGTPELVGGVENLNNGGLIVRNGSPL